MEESALLKQNNDDYLIAKQIIHNYKEPSESLIALLQDLQDRFEYLSEDIIRLVATETGIPASRLMGVASFYAQFKLIPPGKYKIMVCMGTACHVNKGEKVADAVKNSLDVEEGKTTDDGLFSWEEVACLGCCSLSPVMMINGQVYGKLDGDKVNKIINNIKLLESGVESK